jgi:hypothetical protein
LHCDSYGADGIGVNVFHHFRLFRPSRQGWRLEMSADLTSHLNPHFKLI